ncbi:hypothetical protein [Rhizobium mesoamericanum]|uniref:hypothetical protein n=1 Tax=Rhizobium mesoamericanum TaxID=1079800 RepID=UPI00048C630C|nr:hypothetical protein [Rhizobium mesoamericanum]
MDLSYHSRNAASAARARRRIRREGTTMRGDKIWKTEEDDVVRSHYPDYAAIRRALPHRTYFACRNRARTLGIVKERPLYTTRELSIVRRLYPEGSKDDILSLLPGREWEAVKDFAKRHGIRRKPKPFKATGVVVLDQIRSRCRELNYTMPDLDKVAKTKRYFAKSSWLKGHIHHKAIGRAVRALFGDIKAEWK